jgi:aspartyl-tRNA(Asn)/glutamyl-tRNA(Gln) amidotransferase subunit A
VAAGLVPMATASDGGGSTRIPASFAGLFGMKASLGRIPHPGEQPSQTSVFGILATTVRDSARHLDVTAGPDGRDRLSLPPAGVRYEDLLESLDVRGLRARLSPDLGFGVVDPEVAAIVADASAALVTAAGLVGDDEPVVLRDPARVWQRAGYLDLWMHMERGMWPGVADELTGYVRSVLEQTEGFTAPRAAVVHHLRQELQEDAARLFEEVDVVLCPTTAVPAFAAEGPPPATIAGREVPPVMSTPFTMLANLTGNPACSVPAGLTAGGLPVGLQIIGRRHADDVVLRLARIFEQARPWPRHAIGAAS